MTDPSASSVAASWPAIRLGMLTPSSNTVLEPMLARMIEALPQASLHFARFRVTEISLGDRALRQFVTDPMLQAADLLADARVAHICWNGTSGGWLGFERDRELCAVIEHRTGIAASTSVLSLQRIFQMSAVRTFGLVTPYVDAVQARIIETFADEGYVCADERHLGEHRNFAFSELEPERIAEAVRAVGRSRPDAIAIFCTNLRGAHLAAELEVEIGVPVYDTIAVGLWGALSALGVSTTTLRSWGGPFRPNMSHSGPGSFRETPLA